MQNRNSRRVRKREGKREEIFEGIGLRISCQINVQHQTTEQEAQRTLNRTFREKKKRTDTNKRTPPHLSISSSKIKKKISKQVRGENPLLTEKQQ